MQLCAFLAPDAIPEELFFKSAWLLEPDLLPAIGQPGTFNKLLAIVLKFSLLSRDRQTSTLQIHRLVQVIIRDMISTELQGAWIEIITALLNQLFPFDEVAPWQESQRYLSHVLIAIEHSNQWNLLPDQVTNLLNKLGIYFYRRAQYSEGESYFKTVLVLNERMLGPEHPNVAADLNNLGSLYSEQGRYEEATSHYQRALSILEGVLGPEHPNVAASLNNLGVLYHEQGRYGEAASHYQRALDIYERVLGAEHPNTVKVRDNLIKVQERMQME